MIRGSGGARPLGPSGAPSPRARVLVVDDEPRMLESVAVVLGDDFDVSLAPEGDAALQLLATATFHVVCSDFRMPGINGLELLRRVAGLPAYTSTLLLTGSSEYAAGEGVVMDARHHVLLKPYDPERLLSMVAQLARVAEMKRSVERLTTAIRRKP